MVKIKEKLLEIKEKFLEIKEKLFLYMREHKKIAVLYAAAVLVVICMIPVIYMTTVKKEPEEAQIATTGKAEAVMTTKTTVSNGIWSQKRYSDELYSPIGMVIQDGNLVVADSMCDRIQIFDGKENIRVGKVEQYGVSYVTSGALVDGYRESAVFNKPSDVALSPDGSIIICDTNNHVIRRMDDTYVITIAGNSERGYSNGKEGKSSFNAPRSVAVDANGIIYVADTLNHCIRKVDLDGNVTLYAGTPQESGYRDGALEQAQFYEPVGLCFSQEGELYIADSANHCIRKIEGDKVITVVGMPGEIDKDTGYSPGGYIDGTIEESRFNFPRDIDFLEDGSMIVADSLNHAVRMVTPSETRTLAGNGMGERYYESVENLKLTRPEGVCVDGDTLYIADTLNNCIVSIPLTQRILAGRLGREAMLAQTGISTHSKYSYNGEIRVYINGERLDMGRVQPWNSADYIYVPIRPLFEALGGRVVLDEKTEILTITIGEEKTLLKLNEDYFILKGIAVTTTDEITRLFPYTFEWFSEFSLIAIDIPFDLVLD